MRARALRQSSTDAEHALWNALSNRRLDGHKFRRQYPIGPFFADFACVEVGLVVELDGSQHFEPEAVEKDRQRTRVLNANGFQVLRFDDRQMLTEPTGVLSVILDGLTRHHPHPNPLPPAGEGVEST